MQAGFKADHVEVVGRFSDYTRVSDEADRKEHVFHFCPDCGTQVFYREPDEPDLMIVSVGAFADPTFPPPTESGYDHRRHPWVVLPDTIEEDPAVAAWAPVQPLYAAGRYAEAADRGAEVLESFPHPRILFNLACCETLAGRTADAVGHLRQAIEMWEGCRELAQHDPDFDRIREERAFEELVGRKRNRKVRSRR